MAERDPEPDAGTFPGREPDVNVVGGELLACSLMPLTGFYRDGCCGTGAEDVGSHTICAVMTDAFLAFSALAGNDLSTPRRNGASPGSRPATAGACARAAGSRRTRPARRRRSCSAPPTRASWTSSRSSC